MYCFRRVDLFQLGPHIFTGTAPTHPLYQAFFSFSSPATRIPFISIRDIIPISALTTRVPAACQRAPPNLFSRNAGSQTPKSPSLSSRWRCRRTTQFSGADLFANTAIPSGRRCPQQSGLGTPNPFRVPLSPLDVMRLACGRRRRCRGRS